jgi:hypothetical protein
LSGSGVGKLGLESRPTAEGNCSESGCGGAPSVRSIAHDGEKEVFLALLNNTLRVPL